MRIIIPQKRKRVNWQPIIVQKHYDEDWNEIRPQDIPLDTEAIAKAVEEYVESRWWIEEEKKEYKPYWDYTLIPLDEATVESLIVETGTNLKKLYKKIWGPIDTSRIVNKKKLADLIIKQRDASKED